MTVRTDSHSGSCRVPCLPRARTVHLRRGNVVIYVTVGLVMSLGFAAMAVDLGMLFVTRTELQSSADAAALAGAMRLLDESRLKGQAEYDEVTAQTRAEAAAMAAANRVLNASPYVDQNQSNAPDGDVVIGYLRDPTDFNDTLSFDRPELFNSVQVRVRRDPLRNGAIPLIFARVFGEQSVNGWAQATATFQDGVTGYEVTDQTGNADLLPLSLHVNWWQNLMSGAYTHGDNYTFDPETGQVTPGPDGIEELNIFPGAGSGQLPPGNFGTVDIGNPNNSTADISRQIRYGVSADDLAWFGGRLYIPPGGSISLNGDTGLSAAIKDDLEAIKGLPRAIPLFNEVSGPGNNAYFNVIGFAGIRIMNVKLTGSMSSKRVVVQPAYVVDDAAIAEAGGNSYYVYRPVALSR